MLSFTFSLLFLAAFEPLGAPWEKLCHTPRMGLACDFDEILRYLHKDRYVPNNLLGSEVRNLNVSFVLLQQTWCFSYIFTLHFIHFLVFYGLLLIYDDG